MDITKDVEALRAWRALTGGAGVPAIAHGNDFIVGFNVDRWTQLLDCCAHSSMVDEAALPNA